MNNEELQSPFLKPPFFKDPEIWKPITMYPVKPNMYMVSNAGRVINHLTGHIMKQGFINTGYLVVPLCTIFGYVRHFLVHRLVAYEFIPNPENKETVNHLDAKYMNYDKLLEWATQEENNRHARLTGRSNTSCDNNYQAKFTNEQVETICQMLCNGYSYEQILTHIGFEVTDNNRDLIGNIRRGIAWTNISKKYDLSNVNAYEKHQIFDDATIEKICKAIASGMSIKDIIINVLGTEYKSCSKENKREYECIRRIKNKQQFRNISDKYF